MIPIELEIFLQFLKRPTARAYARRPKWVETVAPQTDKAVGVDIVCSA